MKRMASDSKILIDKTFRRKISEKKIQLLEQNLEQVTGPIKLGSFKIDLITGVFLLSHGITDLVYCFNTRT